MIEENKNNYENEKNFNENNKNTTVKSNKIDNNQNTEENFDGQLTEFPRSFPQEAEGFAPLLPQKKYHSMILNTQHLTKRIYLEMLRAIRNYDELENISPQEDKNTINNLKDQMEIVSVAILNIYKNNYPNSRLPVFNSFRTRLSADYRTALTQMYNRVYHIFELTNKLLIRTNISSQRTTLIIIIANLKSQLNTLNSLKK